MKGILDTLSIALGKLLSPPIILFYSILKNIDQEIFLIQRLYSSGQGISLGRLFSLLRWSALVLFIFGICLFLIVDTMRRVMFAEKKVLRRSKPDEPDCEVLSSKLFFGGLRLCVR